MAAEGVGETGTPLLIAQGGLEMVDDMGKPLGSPVSVTQVFVLTFLMASATGLGALPFFVMGRLSEAWGGLANALACGVMLAASFDLVHEGQPYGAAAVVVGLVAGALFISASQKWLKGAGEIEFADMKGADARKMLLMVGIMTAHSFGEGAGVGVSFSGQRGWSEGLLVTLAIGVHNIPEGLAISTVMAASGATPMNCLLWSIFTSLPQTILAVPSFMFVETFQALLPLGMGFAAGCMLWIVFAELLPDAMEAVPPPTVATAATLSAASLEGFRMLLANVQAAPGAYTPSHSAVLLLPAMGVAALAAAAGPAAALAAQALLPDRLHGHVPGRAGFAAGAGAALALLGCVARSGASAQTLAELLIGSFGYLLIRSRSPQANARPPVVPVLAGDGAVGAGGVFPSGPAATARKRSSVPGSGGGGAGGKDVEAAESAREARMSIPGSPRADALDSAGAGGGFGLGSLLQPHALSPAARAAACLTFVAACNAACEGIMVGAGAHRASGGGESRVLLPGALTTLVRGVAVVGGVQSLTRLRSAAMCAVVVVAVAQLSGSATGVFGVPHFIAKGAIPQRALATSAGAFIAACAHELYTPAASTDPKVATLATGVGVIAAGAVAGTVSLLCKFTPYCITQ